MNVLKGIAIAAGAGLAAGVAARSFVGPRRHESAEPLEPLAKRLKAIESRLAELEVREELPVDVSQAVDACFAARAQQLERRIGEEIETLDARLRRDLDTRVGAIEKALPVQAAALTELRLRAEKTSVDLDRLIVAVERLCERMDAPRQPLAMPEGGKAQYSGSVLFRS
jgi:hypothetical protein